MLQLSFIWQANENIPLRHEDGPTQKQQREKKPPVQYWLLFLCFFSLPSSLSYVNWASQESCFFQLRSSLRSSDLSLFYFHGRFPSLSFSHHHSGKQKLFRGPWYFLRMWRGPKTKTCENCRWIWKRCAMCDDTVVLRKFWQRAHSPAAAGTGWCPLHLQGRFI